MVSRDKSIMAMILCWVLACSTLQGRPARVPHIWSNAPSCSGSTVVLPASGGTSPFEHFTVYLNIGLSLKAFDMVFDTGSDLTWVECDAPDAPCTGCTQASDRRYKPSDNFVLCEDPLCDALAKSDKQPCKSPKDRCEYKIEYADDTSSGGFLVHDSISLRLRDGSFLRPVLTFGCGYKQHYPKNHHPMAGLLGLRNDKISIVSQLIGLCGIRNVLGHCLGAEGGGFLFIGKDLVPSSKVTWVPFSSGEGYQAGPAELLHDGKPTGVRDFPVDFDSGYTSTYFITEAYQAVLDKIRADLEGKPLEEVTGHEGFEICWKGAKPFQSVNDVKNYLTPLALSFMKGKAQLQLRPEDYLVITKRGTVCLAIVEEKDPLDTTIGDISMQERMVIYDNEKKQIGWISANCANQFVMMSRFNLPK